MVDGYEFSDDSARIDRDLVWRFLSTEAYWGRRRTRTDMEFQLASAWRLVGAYETATGAQVGFARAVSDGIAFGYLADVFVIESARKRGVGTGLVSYMIDRGPGRQFRWMLHTADAHGLYASWASVHHRPRT